MHRAIKDLPIIYTIDKSHNIKKGILWPSNQEACFSQQYWFCNWEKVQANYLVNDTFYNHLIDMVFNKDDINLYWGVFTTRALAIEYLKAYEAFIYTLPKYDTLYYVTDDWCHTCWHVSKTEVITLKREGDTYTGDTDNWSITISLWEYNHRRVFTSLTSAMEF